MSGFPYDADVSVPISIEGQRTMMHALDYRDVALTPAGARMVASAARTVLSRYMPGSNPDKLTLDQAVAMFVDRVYWIESSGGLVMCTDMPDTSFCLPIPKDLWALRDHTRVIQ
ncbi:hypothetical protein [Salidesulfovibrio onnuriiensis]|uniref:hypothetical protein n=1 Tax=Salidesulfovibrio onnuriiensis TaxID=2583823 RepID=UPI0011CC1B10|nr:hypothetical protein [Salidesulfovibrio onnuriiensis]